MPASVTTGSSGRHGACARAAGVGRLVTRSRKATKAGHFAIGNALTGEITVADARGLVAGSTHTLTIEVREGAAGVSGAVEGDAEGDLVGTTTVVIRISARVR